MPRVEIYDYEDGQPHDQATPMPFPTSAGTPDAPSPPSSGGPFPGLDPGLLKAGGGFQTHDVENIQKYGVDAFNQELRKRAGSTDARPFDSQGPGVNQKTNELPVGPFPAPGVRTAYAGGAFDDPAMNFAEKYALELFGKRANPEAGSGAKLYEDFAKQFATMLQGAPFSDQEESALRVKAFDQLEQHKQAEMRQKTQELAARNIPQSSGVYISEMNRIRDKWDRNKSANENALLTSSIAERQRRLTQSLQVLAALAQAEGGRFDSALALSMIPVELQQQAFQMLTQAGGMGNAGFTGGLTDLLQMVMQQGQYDQQGESAALAALMDLLGGLFE